MPLSCLQPLLGCLHPSTKVSFPLPGPSPATCPFPAPPVPARASLRPCSTPIGGVPVDPPGSSLRTNRHPGPSPLEPDNRSDGSRVYPRFEPEEKGREKEGWTCSCWAREPTDARLATREARDSPRPEASNVPSKPEGEGKSGAATAGSKNSAWYVENAIARVGPNQVWHNVDVFVQRPSFVRRCTTK